MAMCKQCQEDGLHWVKTDDDRWKLADKSGERHECKLITVPLYHKDAKGVLWRYREERIAKLTVDICVQQNLDPYKTEWEQDMTGMFLKIKRAVPWVKKP